MAHFPKTLLPRQITCHHIQQNSNLETISVTILDRVDNRMYSEPMFFKTELGIHL